MLRALFIVSVVAMIGAPAASQAEFLYSHDNEGHALEGTYSDLVDAVQQGRMISISRSRPSDDGIVWYRQCPNVSIHQGIVSCYLTDILDTTDTDGGGARTFDEPYAVEAQIYDTNGFHAAIKKDFHTGEALPSHPGSAPFTLHWFAN